MRPDDAGVRWPASLAIVAEAQAHRTVLRADHQGPLRLLKTLYPEGDRVAQAVIVHPPGGLVGGDRLRIDLAVRPGAHLLATTPAATRFYRCQDPLTAEQIVQAVVGDAARLEWLPQETLAYRQCRARNRLDVKLDGQLIASELLALGLPEAGEPFDDGELLQQMAIDGLWLDRGWLRAHDRALLDGPCGLAGHRVLGTLVLAQAQAFEAEALLEATRALLVGRDAVRAGCTALHGRLLLLRVLAHEVEPAQALLRQVWALWRARHWGLTATAPRIWST